MGSGSGRRREQVNIAVDDDIALALRVIAARDGVSVPDLVRPMVDELVARRLEDDHLAEAVRALRASRKTRSEDESRAAVSKLRPRSR